MKKVTDLLSKYALFVEPDLQNTRLLGVLEQILCESTNYQSLIAELEAVLEAEPCNIVALLERSKLLVHDKQFRAAINDLEEAREQLLVRSAKLDRQILQLIEQAQRKPEC